MCSVLQVAIALINAHKRPGVKVSGSVSREKARLKVSLIGLLLKHGIDIQLNDNETGEVPVAGDLSVMWLRKMLCSLSLFVCSRCSSSSSTATSCHQVRSFIVASFTCRICVWR